MVLAQWALTPSAIGNTSKLRNQNSDLIFTGLAALEWTRQGEAISKRVVSNCPGR